VTTFIFDTIAKGQWVSERGREDGTGGRETEEALSPTAATRSAWCPWMHDRDSQREQVKWIGEKPFICRNNGNLSLGYAIMCNAP